MGLSLKKAHARYKQQAGWTEELRAHLFERAGMVEVERVLEVGSGTGAVLNGLKTQAEVHGLDIHLPALQFSGLEKAEPGLTGGDAHALPYAGGSFDLVYCHFLLLWVDAAAGVLGEMKRVTRAGGAVLALAEPDYGGRIDYPDELVAFGKLQREALTARGADVEMGRKLAGLFSGAGLEDVEVGVMGAEWSVGNDERGDALEREVLKADLEGRVDQVALGRMLAVAEKSQEQGERIL
ncbi:MAG: methyltransferase domain-containing protein, partial [Chloroflexi bacterium]|nr:methyltransferase domain-containing protein [Chloroflexota bacterium]